MGNTCHPKRHGFSRESVEAEDCSALSFPLPGVQEKEGLAAARANANATASGTRSLRAGTAANPTAACAATSSGAGSRFSPANHLVSARTAATTLRRKHSGRLLADSVHGLGLHHADATRQEMEEGEVGARRRK